MSGQIYDRGGYHASKTKARRGGRSVELSFDERREKVLREAIKVSCGDPSAERYLRGCRCEDCCYVMASYQKRLRR